MFVRNSTYARRLVGAALACLTVGAPSGCGPAVGNVKGSVYYQDKIVTSGFVTLISNDGVTRNSEIAEDGSYQIAHVRPGKVKVVVSSPPVEASKGRAAPKRPDVGLPRVEEPVATDHQKKTWRELPFVYADPVKSTLTYTVKAGANTHDIKLD
jgi:hypothetical protein